jgi:hypothetical protein
MVLEAVMALCAAATPIRVAVPALPVEAGAELGERLAARLEEGGGLDVVSPAEIAALLDDERAGKLNGCNGGQACLLEGAKLLSADCLIAGRPDEAGVIIELVAGRSGEVLVTWSAPLVDEALIARIAKEVRHGLIPEPSPAQGRSPLRWVPVALGGVALVGGIALFVHAYSQYRRLANGDPTIMSVERAESVAASGRSIEVTAWLLGGVGLALLGGGLAFAFLAPEADVTVGLGWTGGPVVGLCGRLP